MDLPPGGSAGRSTSALQGRSHVFCCAVVRCGRRRCLRRCPTFTPARRPNQGQRYAADPPTVDEIIAIMRHAQNAAYGNRLNGLIVVLWAPGRGSTRRSPTETHLEERRGSILVRHGKNDRRRQVGMDAWAGRRSDLGCQSARRCRSARCSAYRRADARTRLVGQRRPPRAASHRARGRRPPRVAPHQLRHAHAVELLRGHRAAADPATAGALAPVHDRHVPAGDLRRGDRLDRPRSPRADDARERRP